MENVQKMIPNIYKKSYKKAQDAMTKRKEQIEKSSGNNNVRGGRGGRGGARGGGKPMGRSYHAAMQTVSYHTTHFLLILLK